MKKIFLAVSRFFFAHIRVPVWLRDMIMWPIASRIFKMRFDDVVTLKSGLHIKTHLDDILGRLVIFYGPSHEYFWEPATLVLAQKLVKDAKSALVAGSHLGYMALEIRSSMSKDSTLYTFEPVPYLYDISYKNMVLNKNIGKIILDSRALSDKNGEANIRINNIRSAITTDTTVEGHEIIKTTTVDSFLKEKGVINLDFVLLDVEGYEQNVLFGMRDLFKEKSRPRDIIFEVILQNKAMFRDIKKFLEKYGYRLFVIDDDYGVSLRFNKFVPTRLSTVSGKPDIEHSYSNILATTRDDRELISVATLS